MAAMRRWDDSASWHVVILGYLRDYTDVFVVWQLALLHVSYSQQTSLFRVVDEYRSDRVVLSSMNENK